MVVYYGKKVMCQSCEIIMRSTCRAKVKRSPLFCFTAYNAQVLATLIGL